MDQTHLSVFHPVSNHVCRKPLRNSRLSLPRIGMLVTPFFFMLHDLTDFYVERVTAHRIKINDLSCFHNRLSKLINKTKM